MGKNKIAAGPGRDGNRVIVTGKAAADPLRAKIKIRAIAPLDVDSMNKSIRQVQLSSSARRASEVISSELMAMPVNV